MITFTAGLLITFIIGYFVVKGTMGAIKSLINLIISPFKKKGGKSK